MSTNAEKNRESNKCISILATQHFDVLWRKTLAYYRKTQKAVIDKVLDIIDEHSEFRFAFQQANVLRHYVETNPVNAERLKRAVEDGQIEIVGGLETIPDSNMPSGESIVRNILYGREWVKEYFGVEPSVGTMLDAFGSSGQLPQILSKMGYRAFFAGRLPGAEFSGSTPTSLFVWKGIDGSEIAGLNCEYASIPDNNLGAWYGWGILEGFDEAYAKSDLSSEKFIDDIVGGLANISKVCEQKNLVAILSGEEHLPRVELVEALARYNSDAECKANLCRFDEFVDAADWSKADRLSGEYNVEFSGCYTTRIGLKQLNQRAEALLYKSEYLKACLVLNGLLRGDFLPYSNGKELLSCQKQSWLDLTVGQFHDSICGCHIDENYHHILNAYNDAIGRESGDIESLLGSVVSVGCESGSDSGCCSVSSCINHGTISGAVRGGRVFTDPSERTACVIDGQADKLLVVNTMPFAIEEVLEVDAEVSGIIDSGGNYAAVQKDGEKRIAHVKIEAGRSSAYRLDFGQLSQDEKLESLPAEGVEVGQFVVSQNSGGGVVVRDKITGMIVLDTEKANPRIVLREEKGNLWTEEYTGLSWVEKAGESEIESVENGPVFLKITVAGEASKEDVSWDEFEKFQWRRSYYVYHDLSRVDVSVDVDFEGKGTEAVLVFDCDIDSGSAESRYEVPFGSLVREPYAEGTYRLGRGNWPSLSWVNYEDAQRGVAIVHTGTPGCRAEDGSVSFSLLRSATYYEKPLFPAKPEELSFCNGKHSFRFSIIPHASSDEGWLSKARSFVYGPVSQVCKAADGLDQFNSGIAIDKANVYVSTVKPAEDGSGVIVRVYEVMGRETEFSLSGLGSKLKVCEVSMDEGTVVCDAVDCGAINIMPYEIKTFRLAV